MRTKEFLHILHVTPYYAPAYAYGGVVRAVEGLAQALIARGHQVTVLTTDTLTQDERYAGEEEEVRDGVRVIRTRNVSQYLRGQFNLSTPHHMRQTVQSLISSVDVMHCHEFRTVENLVATPIAKESHIPLVLSPHGTMLQTTGRSRVKQTWDRILSPAIAQRFDAVVGLTEQEVTDVQDIWETFGQRRIPTQFHIIPNGIDPTPFQNLPDAQLLRDRFGLGDARIILFMGRLHERKGVDVLAQAFLQADLPNCKLLIVGPDEGMKATLTELHDDRIVLTGYLEGDERLQTYAAADVLALPAVGEGFSMVVLESLASELPVVISPGCNFPEVARANAGTIVEPTVDEVAGALRVLIENDALRLEMGMNGKQLVANHYTWEIVGKQVEQIYRSLQNPPFS